MHLPASPCLVPHPLRSPEGNQEGHLGDYPPGAPPVLPEHYLGGHSKGALPRAPCSQPNSHPDIRPGRHAPSASPGYPRSRLEETGGATALYSVYLRLTSSPRPSDSLQQTAYR
jgi:hypothetical protein